MKKIKVKQEDSDMEDKPIEINMNASKPYTTEDQLKEESIVKDNEGEPLI